MGPINTSPPQEPQMLSEEQVRSAVMDWVRDDLPLGAQMNIGFHAQKLMARLDAARAEQTAQTAKAVWRPDDLTDATDDMVDAALAVDWTHEDERATVHNIWHAMCGAAPAKPPVGEVDLDALERWVNSCLHLIRSPGKTRVTEGDVPEFENILKLIALARTPSVERSSSQASPSSAVCPGRPDGQCQIHVLKTHPVPFAAVRARKKWLEIRKADRDFQEGDTLWLDEYDPEADRKSGQTETRIVTHVLPGGQYGIEPGYVAMSMTDDQSEITRLTKELEEARALLADRTGDLNTAEARLQSSTEDDWRSAPPRERIMREALENIAAGRLVDDEWAELANPSDFAMNALRAVKAAGQSSTEEVRGLVEAATAVEASLRSALMTPQGTRVTMHLTRARQHQERLSTLLAAFSTTKGDADVG